MALQGIMVEWQKKDPTGAAQALQSAPITDQQRQQIETTLMNMPKK
jgi:hypothetical protein